MNKCTEMGCPAACCQDIKIIATTAERQTAWPKSMEVENLEQPTQPGVYYARTSGETINNKAVHIKIIGPCPRLDQHHNCTIYPSHPRACTFFSRNSTDCRNARIKNKIIGNQPISLER